MIITLTMNPSIDYLYNMDSLKLGSQNRSENPIRMIGGKGLNAARTSAILGSEVKTYGALAGINGEILKKLTQNEKFSMDFIKLNEGETRNALTIMHDGGTQTEIVEEGPHINRKIETKILNDILRACRGNINVTSICLSGSVNSKNQHLYKDYIEKISNEFPNIKILVDISRDQLKSVLLGNKKPYFIKPNIHEFSEIINIECMDKKDVVYHLKQQTIFDGIDLVLVSCGEEGAIVKYKGDIYDLVVPSISLVNPTGSGDATVGGAAFAIDNHMKIEDILRYSMACGVANAMEKSVGFVTVSNVDEIREQIEIKKVLSLSPI